MILPFIFRLHHYHLKCCIFDESADPLFQEVLLII